MGSSVSTRDVWLATPSTTEYCKVQEYRAISKYDYEKSRK